MRNWKFLEWFLFIFAIYICLNAVALYVNLHEVKYTSIEVREDR